MITMIRLTMTLLQVYDIMREYAGNQPNVHKIVTEFEKMNREDTCYSAVVIQQREHSRNENFMTYNFYLGYIDRLNENDNEIEIHSTGLNILNNIINGVRNDYFPELEITAGNFIVFNKRFTADCAGVYCGISISVPVEECYY